MSTPIKRYAAGRDEPDVHEDWVERLERRGTLDHCAAQAWRRQLQGMARFLAIEAHTSDWD